jgi:hypothetical protein
VGGKLRARLVCESSAGELLVEHPDADQHRSPGPRPSTLTLQLCTASHGLLRSRLGVRAPTVSQRGESRMKLTVQVVLSSDNETETVVREVFTLQRESLTGDTLGLRLAEAKDLLAAVQDTLVSHQVSTALSAQVQRPDRGIPRRPRDSRPLVMRTLFGTLRPDSPRWWHCPCSPRAATLDKGRTAPLRARLPDVGPRPERGGARRWRATGDPAATVRPAAGRTAHRRAARRTSLPGTEAPA